MRLPFWLAATMAAAPLCVPAAPVAAKLHAQHVAHTPHITLGQLADLSGDPDPVRRLQALPVLQAPLPGYPVQLTQGQLTAAARRAGVAATLAWSGAATVAVVTAAREVPGPVLEEAALRALRAVPGAAGLELHVAHAAAPVLVPDRDWRLVPRPLALNALAYHTPVWLDVVSDGRAVRSVRVAVEVEQPGAVRRGDAVRVLARAGAVEIAEPGVITRGGLKGQLVQVRLPHGRRVAGTLAEGATVVLR